MNAVQETSNCVNSSTGQEKSLSLLAQLVQFYARDGVTDSGTIAKEVGRSERQVRRAKAELKKYPERSGTAREAPSDYEGALARRSLEDRSLVSSTVTGDRSPMSASGHPCPPEAVIHDRVSPLKKGLPHTPSKEITPLPDSTTVGVKGEVAAADAAQRSPAKAGRYAFEGRVVRLTAADFDRWRKAYPAIADLRGSLTAADDYYAEHLKPGEKWFHRVSRWLANENAKAAAPAFKTERQRQNEYFWKLVNGEAVQ